MLLQWPLLLGGSFLPSRSSPKKIIPRVAVSRRGLTFATMKAASASPTIIIFPGNGCTQIRQSNWYGQLHDELTRKHGINCVCENFPDPLHARRDIWVPHMR